jgi:hypothetical protein
MSKTKRVRTLIPRINTPFREMPNINALMYFIGNIPANPIRLLLITAIDDPSKTIITKLIYHAILDSTN